MSDSTVSRRQWCRSVIFGAASVTGVLLAGCGSDHHHPPDDGGGGSGDTTWPSPQGKWFGVDPAGDRFYAYIYSTGLFETFINDSTTPYKSGSWSASVEGDRQKVQLAMDGAAADTAWVYYLEGTAAYAMIYYDATAKEYTTLVRYQDHERAAAIVKAANERFAADRGAAQ